MEVLFDVSAIVGLFLLPAGLAAVVFNLRAFRRRPRLLSVPAAAVSVVVGLALAIPASYFFYPVDPRHRVPGFPFPAAMFELDGTSWLDYVGPLTVPMLLADAAVALFLPQVVIAAARGRNWRVAKQAARVP